MNTELLEALNILEKEKEISKETLLDAIENSLLNACKNHFGKADNIKVIMDHDTCDYQLFAEKTVVETVEDPLEQISLDEASQLDGHYDLGDIVRVPIESKSFGRIATQNAKNLILQKIREEERKVVYDQYFEKEKDIVTGIVQRYVGKNVSINLGKADAMLTENEQVKGEVFKPTERINVCAFAIAIVLTALDDEAYQIKGYDLQADEYVTKPFSMQILLRKIGAVLRRSGKISKEENTEDLLCYGNLRLDLAGYQAWEGPKKLELTQKEFELLREFLENQGRVLTRNQLLDAVWGADYFGEDRIVDTHIKNLRKKLEADYIDTIRGVGIPH